LIGEQKKIVDLIISQLNLLLSLVNGVLDMKLIESGQFESKLEFFDPKQILIFIKAMFEAQAKMIRTTITTETVSAEVLDHAIEHGHNFLLMP